MTNYELSRQFFAWSFENPELINTNHVALYFFILEHQNRMGGKEKFGLPSQMAKDAIGIKSYNTYINALNDLVSWGFIKLIEKSKNQYSSNIVAISKNNKANNKALDKATSYHVIKQRESTIQSNSSIDNSITKQLNNSITKGNSTPQFNAKLFLIEECKINEQIALDFLEVRKNKKAPLTKTAMNAIINECQKNNFDLGHAIQICAERGWQTFKHEWYLNYTKTSKPIIDGKQLNYNKTGVWSAEGTALDAIAQLRHRREAAN